MRAGDASGLTPPASSADLLEGLRAAVDEAAAARGRVVLARCDDESAGRTALRALADHAQRLSVPMLRARCDVDTDGSPFRPWLGILPVGGAQNGRPISRFARLADLAGALREVTRAKPHVVLLEDVDRADRASLLLLEWVAVEIGAWPLALVATYREPRTPTHPFWETLAELLRDPACRCLTTGPRVAAVAERAVFRRDGEYWTISFEDRVVRLRDNKGLRLLAILLARPGELVHVSALPGIVARGHAGARGADGARPHERARIAATKNLKTALTRIAAAHPALGRHLGSTVRRGYHTGYLPDPHRPIVWER